MEHFTVKHYTDAPHPTIKGNGFGGLVVGEYRDEAQRFVDFVNGLMSHHEDAAKGDAVNWVQRYVMNKMRSEAQPICALDYSNCDVRNGFDAGRWSMMHELAAEETRRTQSSHAEGGEQQDNSASPKLLNELYERFIFDDGVDEVTASGAQEFRDFVIQQLSGKQRT